MLTQGINCSATVDFITGRKSLERIHFIIECEDAPITPSMAINAQARAGYPAADYGFYGFECFEDLPGQYTARWHCWKEKS